MTRDEIMTMAAAKAAKEVSRESIEFLFRPCTLFEVLLRNDFEGTTNKFYTEVLNSNAACTTWSQGIRIIAVERFYREIIKQLDSGDNMSAANQLPQYRCHKTVRAVKIREIVCHAHEDPAITIEEFAHTNEFQGGHIFHDEAGIGPIPFDAAYYRKHRPQVGGYYVVYEDGYCSYSPAKAFEDGYTRV